MFENLSFQTLVNALWRIRTIWKIRGRTCISWVLVRGEDDASDSTHVGILPVQLPKEFEDLVDRLLEQDVVDEVSNELLHLRSFLLLNRGSLGRVALRRGRTKDDKRKVGIGREWFERTW